MQVATKKRNGILLPLFPYPSWVRVDRCSIGVPETAASTVISILCKLPPPFFETVLTFRGSDRIAPPQRERNSKKTNRTTFFGRPSDRLFFCRSERSINIAPTAGGNGTASTGQVSPRSGTAVSVCPRAAPFSTCRPLDDKCCGNGTIMEIHSQGGHSIDA